MAVATMCLEVELVVECKHVSFQDKIKDFPNVSDLKGGVSPIEIVEGSYAVFDTLHMRDVCG